jgi:hypothetical protein
MKNTAAKIHLHERLSTTICYEYQEICQITHLVQQAFHMVTGSSAQSVNSGHPARINIQCCTKLSYEKPINFSGE